MRRKKIKLINKIKLFHLRYKLENVREKKKTTTNMAVVTIDVGIKNLAICVSELTCDKIEILFLELINILPKGEQCKFNVCGKH